MILDIESTVKLTGKMWFGVEVKILKYTSSTFWVSYKKNYINKKNIEEVANKTN